MTNRNQYTQPPPSGEQTGKHRSPEAKPEDDEGPRRVYRFSLRCGGNGDGQIKVLRVGDVPGGTKFHLTYLGGRISVEERLVVDKHDDGRGNQSYLLQGKEGKVQSGADWVLVRRDGVAVFDGRLTFVMKDGFVFDVVIAGLAPIPSWPRLEGKINVALPVRFEAAQLTDSWIAEKYRKQGERFHEYKELVRHQGEAVGSMEVVGDCMLVNLNFFQVVPRARA